MPHIVKRNKIYYVYWYQNGKHRSRAISPDLLATKEWASRKHAEIYSRKNGLLIKDYPFNDFYEEYLKNTNKAPRTRMKDKRVFRRFKEIFPEVVFVAQFDNRTLQKYIIQREKDGMSEVTINRELGFLKNMQRYAFDNGYHYTNYSTATIFLTLPNDKEDFVPSDSDIDLLAEKLREPYLTAFILGYGHGCRPGEICHIALSDFNFEKHFFRICKKPELNWQPKNKTSIRNVPIQPESEKYLIKRYELAEKVGAQYICFFEEDGRRIDEQSLSVMFRKIRKKLKIDQRITMHTLRHKFITRMIDKGEPLKRVSMLVGHASVSITEQIYYHYTDEEKLKSMATLNLPEKIKEKL
ncbi:MAG: site-specific integrase [Elusimicrobiota bacterium]|jgi:integrase|nr:site-specific integrase [Elusimicrobiota bacterium]